MSKKPELSVIIPAWNADLTIRATLEALCAQDCDPSRYEVIVVDNGSTDCTVEIVRSFEMRLLEEQTPGSYAARNLGLKHAQGDIIAFTDADCIPSKNWVTLAIDVAHHNPRVGLIGGDIHLFDASGNAGPIVQAYESILGFNQAWKLSRSECATANWISSRQLLLSLGGFDASLKSGGDVKMARLLASLGYPVIFEPRLIVHHPLRSSVKDIRSKFVRTVGGVWSTRRTNRVFGTLAAVTKGSIFRIFLVIRHAKIPLQVRVCLVGLVLYTALAGFVEIVRLSFGAQPRRS